MYGEKDYLEVAEKITQIMPVTLLVVDCYGKVLINYGEDAALLLNNKNYIGVEQINKFEKKK